MAGVYGSLNSREDFRRELDDALRAFEEARDGSAKIPGRRLIKEQLDAMKSWTDNGRDPRAADRGRITLGVIAMRELGGMRDSEMTALRVRLTELYAFFVGWPSDEQAATASKEEMMHLFQVDEMNRAAARADRKASKHGCAAKGTPDITRPGRP